MDFIRNNAAGILVCFAIAVPAWFLGRVFPLVGGPVIGILAGMAIALRWKDQGRAAAGIKFTSKTILQAAVVLLGFGLNLGVVLQTGWQSLPIIVGTIAAALAIAFALSRAMSIPGRTSALIGVGSSICGGSAIAAAAPVVGADDNEVAQAISVIFFFNVIAAVIFPALGAAIGFDTTSGQAFGIFAGTAVNDTSSVTAAASTWDGMWGLGTQTLDKAVTVKLTRTLAIIPITLALAYVTARGEGGGNGFSLKKAFPLFIALFVLASIITTAAQAAGVPAEAFAPLKELSKFCIVMAITAIGLNSNLAKLVKSGGKPIALGACCWVGITLVSLAMQHVMGIW
jgi:uncharacterized integral membrane protein (TIGR00698 family)